MDRISGLSDDVLVKVLSYLPTKVAVSTSVLSKRWDFLWMCLPKLEYVTRSLSESEKLHCFIKRTLPLHRAPVIERFRLNCTHNPKDVELWVVVAVSRELRELDIHYEGYTADEVLLSSSLFACKSLEILKLCGDINLDVPRMDIVSLPSLKILQLEMVTGVNGEFLRRLLTICPLLEKLSVVFCGDYGNISVISLSLHSLSLCFDDEPDELEIDTPSLKYLKLHIENNFSVRNMPKLEEAYVDANFNDIDCLFGSISSVKRLTICCTQYVYSDSLVFNQLDHLKLCDCAPVSTYALTRLLKDSPNLRVLEIFQMEDHGCSRMMNWNEPSTVPECFLSTLQTFNWSGYLGRPANREVVVYILKNACGLKTATISSHEHSSPEKFQMFKELARSPRASATCELIFD